MRTTVLLSSAVPSVELLEHLTLENYLTITNLIEKMNNFSMDIVR